MLTSSKQKLNDKKNIGIQRKPNGTINNHKTMMMMLYTLGRYKESYGKRMKTQKYKQITALT